MWWLLVLVGLLVHTDAPLEQRAQTMGKEATVEVASHLKIVGIYGQRHDAQSDLHLLKINVELAAGAPPLDMSKLVVRYSDGTTTRNYPWSDAPIDEETRERPEWFAATWIRGDGTLAVMEAGDLLEIRFVLPQDLAERTDVRIDLIPETGAPVPADFRTPPTYSTELIVTLR